MVTGIVAVPPFPGIGLVSMIGFGLALTPLVREVK
jgi:hypothetical protein